MEEYSSVHPLHPFNTGGFFASSEYDAFAAISMAAILPTVQASTLHSGETTCRLYTCAAPAAPR